MATAIIGTIVIGSMVFVGFKQFKKLKNGENSCGCNCTGCSKSNSCHGIKIVK